ncbi:hypothetical protein BROUX41_000895 [Berkeleyomyces rouxiae]
MFQPEPTPLSTFYYARACAPLAPPTAIAAEATLQQPCSTGTLAVHPAFNQLNSGSHRPLSDLHPSCISAARGHTELSVTALDAPNAAEHYPPLQHFQSHNHHTKVHHGQQLDTAALSQQQSYTHTQSQPPSPPPSSVSPPLDLFPQSLPGLQPHQQQQHYRHLQPHRHNERPHLHSCQHSLLEHPKPPQDPLNFNFGLTPHTHCPQLIHQRQHLPPSLATVHQNQHQHYNQHALARYPVATSVNHSSLAVPRTSGISIAPGIFPTLETDPRVSSLSLLSAPSSSASTSPGLHYLHIPQPSSPVPRSAEQISRRASLSFSHQLPNSPLLYQSAAMNSGGDMVDPATAFADDIAAQEALARDYQPDLQGPLVGGKTSSMAIMEAYARADPIYIEKTNVLPQTYTHYRPIQGDGNCGWRAIAFSYFEKLAELQDQDFVQQEILRLLSFNEVMTKVGGYDIMLFDDMVDQTITLLKDLRTGLGSVNDGMALITSAFNDPGTQSAIMYHMRLLAATAIKGNPDYEPFTGGLGLEGFCSQSIELPDREIDHLGLDALVAVLLKPANMVLQVVYLDRSPGTEPNTHIIPSDSNIKEADTAGRAIYLLFRPDHYDILYKGRIEVQVNKANISYHSDNKFESTHGPLSSFATLDFSQLAMIPGFTKFPPPSSVSGKDPMSVDHGFMPMESNVWDSNSGLGMVSSQKPSPMATANRIPEIQTPFSQVTAANTQLPLQLHGTHSRQSLTPVSETPSPIIQSSAPEMQLPPRSSLMSSSSIKQQYPLRFSMQYFQLNDSFQQSQPIMRSKNSHLNKAHFKNPRFTPEQWTPRDYEEL